MKTDRAKPGLMMIAAIAAILYGMTGGASVVLAAEFPVLQAYGVDTIAGYSTLMRTSRTFPDRDIVFTVTKPDGVKVNVPSVTDGQGTAKADLYDFHTRRAGKYMISARFQEDLTDGPQTGFKVYPDQVSLEQSSIVAGKTLARADGSDTVFVSVDIRDQYGNPFQGHQINLISSRSTDKISVSDTGAITDVNGSVTFGVSSNEPGVSVFSAVDSTASAVLSARNQVAFIKGSSMLQDAGGNLSMLIPIAEAADAGPLHHFKISDIPVSVQPKENVSFSVTAQDANNLTVENYTGTIHFSAQGGAGDNVNIPEDYTFKAEDLGTHKFSLGLSFTTAGTYKIQVTDTNDTLIKGEQAVTVGTSGDSTPVATGEKPTITSPAAGSYSGGAQTVSGSAPAGSTVNIFDNDQQIGTVQTSSGGSFTFQTNPLSDGVHKIYVVNLDKSGQVQGTSDTAEITVDSTPPSVDEIIIDPTSGIKPGTAINVKVVSEENLSDSALLFNSEIVALTPSAGQPGTYTAQLTAPANAGAYPVDVVLVDQLNNEATYNAKATVNVAEEGGTVQTQETQMTQTQEPETQETQITLAENMPPTEVFGLIAYGSDKKVTLVWEAANDDVNVNHYRVYYGLDPMNMDLVVDTKSAATTWYVPNLQNGKDYYFALSAVDDQGLESINRSEVASARPFTLVIDTLGGGGDDKGGGGELECNLATGLHCASIEDNIPPEVTKNGPELIWLLAGTGVLSGVVRKIRRKMAKGK
jgi:hypothetical protein